MTRLRELFSSTSARYRLSLADGVKALILAAVNSGAAYVFLDYLRMHSGSLIKNPSVAVTVAGVCTIATDLLHRYFDGPMVSPPPPPVPANPEASTSPYWRGPYRVPYRGAS